MSTPVHSPHDKIFRASLRNIHVAKEYIQKTFPKSLLKMINLNKLEACPEIYVNRQLDLSEADVIYKAEIKGRSAYLYLAAEHQSSTDIFMAFRILKYNIVIWQFHRDQNPGSKKLPLIINTVFYSGQSKYSYSTDFKDLINAPRELIDAYWSKPFKLIQVRDIPDKELLAQKWAGLFQLAMKNIYETDFVRVLDKILPKLKEIDARNGVEYLTAVLNYMLSAGQMREPQRFIHTVKDELSKKTGEQAMTGAERLIQIGMEQGMEKGMQHEKLLLIKLLSKRFGRLSSRYKQKFKNASPATLLVWGEKLLDAQHIEEVFQD